jgi:hypothetical protein
MKIVTPDNTDYPAGDGEDTYERIGVLLFVYDWAELHINSEVMRFTVIDRTPAGTPTTVFVENGEDMEIFKNEAVT